MNKLLLTIIFTLSLFGQTKDVNLRLSWKHQFQFAGYYVAKEKGFYKDAGLNVHIKEYDLKVNINDTVSKSKNTFGVGHSELILDKLNKHPNLILLAAINQSSPLVLLSKKRKDLSKLSDIAGKKIMMTSNQIYTASINAMLLSEHLKPDSYKIIEASFKITDLINDTVDLMISYSSNEPFQLQEKGIQYTIFDPKDYDYNFYSDILFTSSQMLKNNPKQVKAFYDASMKGWLYTYSHIDEAVDIILKHYNTQNRSRKALIFEANTLKKSAIKEGVPFGNINVKRLKEITNTFRLLGLVDKNRKTDFSDFIYNGKTNVHLNQKDKKEKDLILYLMKNIIHNKHFQNFSIIVLSILIISLFLQLRMRKLLAINTLKLEKQNELFDKNISSSKTDINGKITYVSQAFCILSGYNKDELIGKSHNMIRSIETPNDIYQDLWLTISSGHTWRGELKNIKKDGSFYWVDSIITPIFNNKQKIIGYKAIRQDTTLKKVLEEFNEKLTQEVQKKTQELKKLAETDKLTDMYNRVKLDEELLYNFNTFIRYKNIYTIIIMDIDHFKQINDKYGHTVGDDVLQEMSNIMKKSIRVTDILGRWGGEEFMIISPNTELDGACALAENIRIKVENTKFDKIDKITLSAGVSQIDSSLNQKDIIIKADEALYRAKDKGRNRVET